MKHTSNGGFYSGVYQNLFTEIGIDEKTLDKRINDTFQTMFYDPNERIYYPLGDDNGYLVDTGNNDARTEGISYGMMMCVQLNKKEEFNRLWHFAKTFMWQPDGKYQGYFAWSTALDGTKNAQGPAPDGEEYFAMALFFASFRWGDGKPPFDYANQARDILHHCLHQHELAQDGHAMWDLDNYLIKFVPEAPFSDPSYHLPHFYELFSMYANEEDRAFWKRAAQASRHYLTLACNSKTGLAAEYAHYDGTPEKNHNHGHYYSDAYRVIMNIGLDAAWFGIRPEMQAIANNLQVFFTDNTTLHSYHVYTIEGKQLEEPALHPVAIIATNAAGSLCSNGISRLEWVQAFWDTPLRKGERRYYDNCLYLFCLLMLSGRYIIFEP